MKLAVISMIRDEADIIGTFLRHLDAMFDIVLLLDQRSSDGSARAMKAACEQRRNWRYLLCDFAGRHQKEVVNLAVPKAFAMGADAVFVLDADEFVAGKSREELLELARDMQDKAAAGRFFWRACVPVRFDQWRFDPEAPARIARKVSTVQKVAVSRALFEQRPDFRFLQGSHGWEATEPEPPVVELGELCHFPLRSRQQAQNKTFIGSISYFSKGNLMRSEGWHRRQMLDHVATGAFGDEVLAGFAACYGDETLLVDADAPPRLNLADFETEVPRFARSQMALPDLAEPDFGATLAQALRQFRLELPCEGPPRFEFCGEAIYLRDGEGAPASQIQRLDSEMASLKEALAQIEAKFADLETESAGLRDRMDPFRNLNWLVRISGNARRLLGRRDHGA
jgi:hypothetical protein